MSVTVAGTEFDDVVADRDADVLYLNVSDSEPVFWEETPEGHVVRFDVCRDLCGMTLIGVSEHLSKDGHVKVTIPQQIDLDGVVEYA